MRRCQIRLQKTFLHTGTCSSRLVAHLLKQRFELTLLERGNQFRMIGLDSKIIDRHWQFQMTIQIDHFPVLQNLVARIGELFASALILDLVDIGQ